MVVALQILFNQHNESIRLFRTALEQIPADGYKVVVRVNKTPVSQHEKQYNVPTINDVVIIIVGKKLNSRDIILYRGNGVVQRVSKTHRL